MQVLPTPITPLFTRIFSSDRKHGLSPKRKVNDFLKNINDEDIVDIKYQVATLYDEREQIYCYSAMIIYKKR